MVTTKVTQRNNLIDFITTNYTRSTSTRVVCLKKNFLKNTDDDRLSFIRILKQRSLVIENG